MKVITEKRLQPDFSEKWQVFNPLTNKYVTCLVQDDTYHQWNNKIIINEMKQRKGIA